MNVVLWILAALLAALFLASGAKKLVQSREQLVASGYTWTEDFTMPTIKTIGVLEILGAAGLVLPALVDVAPVLVPVAATGLTLLMLGATLTHLRRKEPAVLALTLPLALLPLALAITRFGPNSFS